MGERGWIEEERRRIRKQVGYHIDRREDRIERSSYLRKCLVNSRLFSQTYSSLWEGEEDNRIFRYLDWLDWEYIGIFDWFQGIWMLNIDLWR